MLTPRQFADTTKAVPREQTPAPSIAATVMSWLSKWVVFRHLVSIILVCAALLKLRHMLAGGDDVSILSAFGPRATIVLVAWELMLGFGLALNILPRLLWHLLIIQFGAMGISNTIMSLQGRSSCGCLGGVHVHPAITLGLCIAVLGLLVGTRRTLPTISGRSFRRDWISIFATVVACGIGVFAIGSLFDARIAAFRGDLIVTEPAVIQVEAGFPSAVATVDVTIANMSGDHIRLIGGQSSCGVDPLEGLPVSVASGTRVTLPIRFQYRNTEGRQDMRFCAIHRSPGASRRCWSNTDGR